MACINCIQELFPDDLPNQACFVSPNSISLIPWMAATASLGIPTTGIDYTLEKATLHEIVVSLNTELLLVSSNALGGRCDALDFGPPNAKKIDIDSITSAVNNDLLINTHVFDLHDINKKRKPFKSIGITSGTSGSPKLVVRYNSFDARRFSFFSEKYNFSENDRFLVSMPLYHAAGNGWARMFLSLGATLFLANINSTRSLVNQLLHNRINASVMTPIVLSSLIDLIETESLSASLCLRWLLIGGKQFPEPLKSKALSILGPIVFEYYGTTETGVNTIAEPHDIKVAPTSVGRAFCGNTIKIIGEDGIPLPPHKVGTVYISSYMNMDHYGDGTTDEIYIEKQKYIKTPDQGYLDTNDRLFLINRLNSSKTTLNIYSLEDEIRKIASISDVALTLSKDMIFNCAFVTKNIETDQVRLINDIRAIAENHGVKLFNIKGVNKLPYSPSGKIKSKELDSLF